MKKLIIAGTSVGGSSYASRVIKAINSSPNKEIEVVINNGGAQSAVYVSVTTAINDINKLLFSMQGGSLKVIRGSSAFSFIVKGVTK